MRIEGTSVPMRIADAKVIVCSRRKNFVTLKLVTEDGTCGLGNAALDVRELAVRRRAQE
jgi:mannonate dehydratase